MIAFNHVVPVLNLSVFNVRRAPAFAFEQSKRATIGGRFIRVDESRDLPLLHVVEDFTQKPVCSFAVTTGGEIKIDSAAPAVDGPVQIRPAAIDLHVGFIHVPRAKIGRVTPVPAQPFFHFRRITLNPAVNRGVIDIHSAFSQHLLQLTVTDAVFAVPAYGPQNDVTLKMPAFEWVHVQLHQQKGMISLSPPTICNSAENLSTLPAVRLKNLARYAGMTSVFNIARMSPQKRMAVLVAFVLAWETLALDDALDVLDAMLAVIIRDARKIGQKKRLRSLKDLDKSALALASACSYLLKEETPDESIRAEVFSYIPRQKLAEIITLVREIARPSDDNFHEEMVEQYGRVRRFLPHLLNTVKFSSAPAGVTTLNACDYLSREFSSRRQFFDDAPTEIISRSWKRLVINKEKHITRRGYTLCFLSKLQDSLRRRDVYVTGSNRWGDPRARLLQGADWQANRIKVYRSLGHPTDPQEAIKSLGHQLDSRYRQVAARLCENEAVELDVSGPKPRLTISPLASLDEPDSLKRLSKMISDLLPPVDLTELLLEINAHTGFADEFFHASEASARVDDLPVSISAVLMAEACNIGLEPLIRSNVPALTRHRLNWTKANYLRAETITSANARLVDFQATLPLAQIWGGGEVASADGMRFVTPVRTINAGPNRKYFGNNRGITWYNFVSDQYSGFHGIVIPGTLRDSIFVLEGLLEQETGLNPTEIMTDTAGASELVFGLFWLLGYQFSPRLADAGASVFWRMDHDADYGVLNDIARGQSDPRKIVLQWDEMIRTAGSLKLGKVQASVLVRSLLKSERPSGLTQAIIEVGRINKTLYLLNYIDDEDYRRRILTQLNRGESRHAVARAICHGQKGEIRKRYTDGQEDQLGALGLVTNAVVLWNTIYMQAALDHLRAQGETLNDEDIARLSPLCHGHINMLGHYSFTLAELVTKGHLRPLKEASEAENVA